MRRLSIALAAAAMVVAASSIADAAPMPSPLGSGGNHPAYPQLCVGGPFGDQPVVGWVVLANGGSNGALPTAFFYEGGDFSTPPDFSTTEPIVGVSMYRTTTILDEVGAVDAFFGQGRGSGDGTRLDFGDAITAGIDTVTAKWDLAACTVSIPGDVLNFANPDADPPYVDDYTYIFTNYVKG